MSCRVVSCGGGLSATGHSTKAGVKRTAPCEHDMLQVCGTRVAVQRINDCRIVQEVVELVTFRRRDCGVDISIRTSNDDLEFVAPLPGVLCVGIGNLGTPEDTLDLSQARWVAAGRSIGIFRRIPLEVDVEALATSYFRTLLRTDRSIILLQRCEAKVATCIVASLLIREDIDVTRGRRCRACRRGERSV